MAETLLGVLEPDPNHPVENLDGVAAHGLLADEARTGGEVEGPAVICAGEVAPEDVAFDEGISLVGARVLDRVDLAVDLEDGDGATLVLDQGASLGDECGERNREPFHAA